MPDTEAEVVARALDEAEQQAVTTLRSAEQTVRLLESLVNRFTLPAREDAVPEGVAYALRDARDVVDRTKRCRRMLAGLPRA